MDAAARRARLAARVEAVHRDQHAPAPHRFVRQLPANFAQAGVADAAPERLAAHAAAHRLDVQIFDGDHGRAGDSRRGQPVLVIAPQVADPGVQRADPCLAPAHPVRHRDPRAFGNPFRRVEALANHRGIALTAVTSLVPAQAFLLRGQVLGRCHLAVGLAVADHRGVLQAQVDADRVDYRISADAAGQRRHTVSSETAEPTAGRIPTDCDGSQPTGHCFAHAEADLADAVQLHAPDPAVDQVAPLIQREACRHHRAELLAAWPLGPTGEEVAPRLVEVAQRLVERLARQFRQPGRVRRRLQLRELAAERDGVELGTVRAPRFVFALDGPIPHKPPRAKQAQHLPLLCRLQAKPHAIRTFDGGRGFGHDRIRALSYRAG